MTVRLCRYVCLLSCIRLLRDVRGLILRLTTSISGPADWQPDIQSPTIKPSRKDYQVELSRSSIRR
jgi:hypothetical protein